MNKITKIVLSVTFVGAAGLCALSLPHHKNENLKVEVKPITPLPTVITPFQFDSKKAPEYAEGDAGEVWQKCYTLDNKVLYFTENSNPPHIFKEPFNYIYTDYGIFAFDPDQLSLMDFMQNVYLVMFHSKEQEQLIKDNRVDKRLL